MHISYTILIYLICILTSDGNANFVYDFGKYDQCKHTIKSSNIIYWTEAFNTFNALRQIQFVECVFVYSICFVGMWNGFFLQESHENNAIKAFQCNVSEKSWLRYIVARHKHWLEAIDCGRSKYMYKFGEKDNSFCRLSVWIWSWNLHVTNSHISSLLDHKSNTSMYIDNELVWCCLLCMLFFDNYLIILIMWILMMKLIQVMKYFVYKFWEKRSANPTKKDSQSGKNKF